MTVDAIQRGVLRGMGVGAGVALAIVVLGSWLDPLGFGSDLHHSDRLAVAVQASIVPAVFLAIAIGRLARHRFFTPADIDGGGLARATQRAALLQSLLQNTLEQAVLAVFAYFIWAVAMPPGTFSVIPLAAMAYGVGRVLFFVGYARGAPARAVGFTLSFYTSVAMLAVAAAAMLGHALIR